MGGGFDGPGFTGTFDGAGFSIRGVVIDSTDSYVGLFSKIGENGVVKDLILTDSFISWGDSNIGAFCAMNEGNITSCVNSSSVVGYSLQIGGICGFNEGIISECVNEGVIRSTGSFSLGGICGYQFMGSSSTSIENCRNSASVSATFEAAAVGGICGWNENSIAHCSNDGLVSGEDNAFVGGLCGNNSYKLTDSYWLDTTCEGGVGNATEWSDERSIDAKTSAQYASGEVAWLLNQGQEAPAWGQASAMPDLLAFEGSLSVPVRVRLVHHAQITTWYLEKGSMLPVDERPSLADGEVVVDGNNTVIDPTSYVFEEDTTLSVLSGTLPFTDVSAGDWFYGSVGFAYSQGLMTGTSVTTFEPNTSLSRAMLVAVLHRLEGSPQASAGDFTDVADGDWYAQAVNWAASVGVVNGMGDGTFQPNTAITREQLAAILRNYAQYKGLDVTATGDLSTYSDAASVSAWAKESVEWAVGQGLLSGMTVDTLQPQGLSTRAQVAAVLQRYLEN
ncbi:MAG: S-layer homology domain-containing protein [Peptococcaceae bacterium]|nr:S-layer homology domain-containing protein [Peptococcaceae bacterium]